MWLKALAIFAFCSSTFALQTNELVDSVRAKLGGVSALNKLTALEEKGTIKVDKLSGTYQKLWSATGLFTDDMDLGIIKMKIGIDKDGAWMMDLNGGVAVVGGEQAISLQISQLLSGWYCFRPESKTKWNYLGDTPEGDHRLQTVLPIGSGFTCEMVIGAKNGLPQKLLVPHGAENEITTFGDYRSVDGVMAPFHFEETSSGNLTISDVTEIKAVTGIKEEAFTRPQSRDIYTMEGDKTTWKVTPFSKYQFIEGKINGQGPYVFFIDTGASNSAIDSAVADVVGVKKTGGMSGQAVGGNVDVEFGTIASLELPGVTFSDQLVASVPLQENVGKYMPQLKIGGIIGYDILGRFIVEMDYANSTLTLYRPKTFQPAPGMKFIPMEISDGIVGIHGAVEGKELYMMLDTGSGSNIHFTTACVQREKYLDNRKTAITWWGGAAGIEEGKVGKIANLEIAGFKMENLVAEFTQSSNGALGATNYDANLGAGVLSRFNVVFDYPGSRLGLAPNARFAEQEEPDRLGMLAAPQVGSIKVIKIDPQGSAAKAGIMIGDDIVKVDDRSVMDTGFAELRDLMRKPAGTVIQFTVKREKKEIVIPVTLIDRF